MEPLELRYGIDWFRHDDSFSLGIALVLEKEARFIYISLGFITFTVGKAFMKAK